MHLQKGINGCQSPLASSSQSTHLTISSTKKSTETKTDFVVAMRLSSTSWCLLLCATLFLPCSITGSIEPENGIRTTAYLSPKFVLGPGSVENKHYFNIDFPTGHIAIKSFNGEVVDEEGNSVPLQETYLHHWVVGRYFHQIDSLESNKSQTLARNDGICQGNHLGQYFGLGSETRRTETLIPDPYGIEVGNPNEIPDGYEEQWMLNVHAIDTRGVEDKLGCTECKCDLYNVTVDEYGRPLRPDYRGGLLCCYDQTQCRVTENFQGPIRNLYLKYTVVWTDWEDFMIPVKIFILDITDTQKIVNDTNGLSATHDCRVEYEVEVCTETDHCIDTKRTSLNMPNGGYVVYGVAHQHSGGLGSNLYGEDGRVICSSIPTYGEGKEAGNEAGYIVGMSTCYPELGSVKIRDWESLVLESNYSSTRTHTGVMALFYLLVADRLPDSSSDDLYTTQTWSGMDLPNLAVVAAFVGVAIALALAMILHRSTDRGDGYQSIAP